MASVALPLPDSPPSLPPEIGGGSKAADALGPREPIWMQFTILDEKEGLLGVYLVKGAEWYGPFFDEEELNEAWREIKESERK